MTQLEKTYLKELLDRYSPVHIVEEMAILWEQDWTEANPHTAPLVGAILRRAALDIREVEIQDLERTRRLLSDQKSAAEREALNMLRAQPPPRTKAERGPSEGRYPAEMDDE